MLSKQKVKNLLADWSLWVGNDPVEIKKDCGWGKSAAKICVDVAPHNDPYKGKDGDAVRIREMYAHIDEGAVRAIDKILKSKKLSDTQKDLITARYHWKWSATKIIKRLRWYNDKYYRLHDEAIEIIGANFHYEVVKSSAFKSFV